MIAINENNTIDSILNNSNNVLLCSSYKNKYEQIQCPNKRKNNLMFCGKHRNMTDIIFAPCLAFDMRGFRLGYGGGYYDRTIAYYRSLNHNFSVIGYAYDDQKIDQVIHNNLDQKLDYILTEKQLYKIQ